MKGDPIGLVKNSVLQFLVGIPIGVKSKSKSSS